MKVPLKLVKRPEAAAAEAFLLVGDAAGPLAEAVGRSAAPPKVFRVAGGFVLVFASHPAKEPRAAIRLRKLGANFYLPADADLKPALLPEEIADLAAKRGLVALPGGTVLAFDPGSPLPPSAWLQPPAVRREEWQPIPPAAFHPDRLTRIEFLTDRPAAILEILNEGRPDDADPLAGPGKTSEPIPDDARPQGAGAIKRFGAGAALAGAKLLAWLGRHAKMPGLAKLGGALARKAVESVPRISEKLLGAQEAALREVLRQLQSGDAEKALRRAPIAVGDPDAPSRVSDSASLGNVDPRYSLRSLLGGGGGGVASAWLGGGDVWQKLAEEYRRLAREALARGDVRRAAYLYGVLLRDLRSAANALAGGGLHADAAVIYRDKLNDPLAAAQEFEKAGHVEEALRLYERIGKFETAAEMLRGMGDEDRAEEYFRKAADALGSKGAWLAAGDLLRTKIARHDLAAGCYSQGWAAKTPETVACGQHLLDHALATEEWTKADELFDEGMAKFYVPRQAEADAFFNYALRVDKHLPAVRREDWRDRVKLRFAEHVRRSGHPARSAGDLFADGRNWPAEVLRDATFATRKRETPPEPVAESPPTVHKLLDGTVVAVAVARDSRDLIVASTTAVVCWRVKERRVIPLPGAWIQNEVLGLSVDARAENVFVLFRRSGGVSLQTFQTGPIMSSGATDLPVVDVTLQAFRDTGAGVFVAGGVVEFNSEESEPDWYLAPHAWNLKGSGSEPATVVANSYGHFAYRGHMPKADTSPTVFNMLKAHLIEIDGEKSESWCWAGQDLTYRRGTFTREWSAYSPSASADGVRFVSSVDPIATPGVLEITAVDGGGTLGWARFEANEPEDHSRSHKRYLRHPDLYAAACLLKSETVAAVSARNELVWLRLKTTGLEPFAPSVKLESPSQAVFLAARPHAAEVAVVFADGTARLVAIP